MSKAVTFKQLQRTLNGLGFESQHGGRHVTFRHPRTGTVLTVPNIEPTIRPIYVSTAARQVANSGIATMAMFGARLQRAVKEAG